MPKEAQEVVYCKVRLWLWQADTKEVWDLTQVMHYPAAMCDPTLKVPRSRFAELFINLQEAGQRDARQDKKVCLCIAAIVSRAGGPCITTSRGHGWATWAVPHTQVQAREQLFGTAGHPLH